ncbi:MAG: hypothetical protein P1V51_08835 [Deltaproteobacteria bacterium]|nr:hypothetical protein [Deltaproteobacteria bacterium]
MSRAAAIWGVLAAGLALLWSAPVRAESGEGVPRGKILVLDLEGASVDESLREILDGILATTVRDLAPEAEVASSDDVRTLLGIEAQKQLLGCGEDSCLTEIAGSLGAEHIVAGTVGKIGGAFALTLRLIDTEKAGLRRSIARETLEGQEALLALIRSMATELIDPSRLAPPPTPPAASGPRTWSVGLSLGAVSNALLLADGVGLDAELAFRLRASEATRVELAAGLALPGSFPLSLRYLYRTAPLELGLVLRATPFTGTAAGIDGELRWAVGAGASVGASFRTPAGLLGLRLEVLYSEALGLGGTLPLTLAAVWRL